MRKLVLLVLSLGTLFPLFAQKDTIVDLVEAVVVEEEKSPVLFAEIDAVPLAGLEEWYKSVASYCRENYPEREREAGIEGKVFVSFIIEKDGSLSDVRILKGYTKNLDRVALDAIRTAGNWKPAKQGGKEVRLMKRLPIKFNDSNPKTNPKVPIAKIGDMELMKFIHQQSKAYSIKKKIENEEVVYVRISLDKEGNQTDRIVMKSSDDKLNKQALKFVKSYKQGWIMPTGLSAGENGIVLPVIFSQKIDVENL